MFRASLTPLLGQTTTVTLAGKYATTFYAEASAPAVLGRALYLGLGFVRYLAIGEGQPEPAG